MLNRIHIFRAQVINAEGLETSAFSHLTGGSTDLADSEASGLHLLDEIVQFVVGLINIEAKTTKLLLDLNHHSIRR